MSVSAWTRSFPAPRRARERDAWTLHNLDLVQMTHAKDKRPGEISGGMKQRVGIARALAMEPKVLLLDEPFGALDALTRAHLQDSVMALHQKLGNTVLMITHDVDEAVLLSDRIVMMTNGPAARIGEVLDVPLARPRKRLEMAANPTYLKCRQRVLEFLYERHHFVWRPLKTRVSEVRGKKMSEPLVVIGNGMAAARFVEELTTRALGRYSVAVIGNEGKLAYNRVLLSSVLANETELSDIELKSFDWWKDRGVTLLYDHAAVSVDPAIRRVRLANGATLPYKHLVFATGSRPIRPCHARHGSARRSDLPRPWRCAAIRKAAGPQTRAVVIGGGLLGLEAAYGLAKARAKVTLASSHGPPDGAPARSAGRRHAQERGRVPRRRSAAKGRDGTHRGHARRKIVTLSDGRRIEADLVVVAVGIRPNTDLARKAGARHQSRHRRQRQARNLHPRSLCHRRMRGASRAMLRPG